MTLRVAIDYRPALTGRGGIGVYTRCLVSALAALDEDVDLHLYAHRFRQRRAPQIAHTIPAGATKHDLALPAALLRMTRFVGLGAEDVAGGAHLVHLTDYVRLPIRRAPFVATIHDVLFARFPNCYTQVMRDNLDRVTRYVAKHAARILVPSERTRADLVERFGVHEKRIRVTPLAARPSLQPASLSSASSDSSTPSREPGTSHAPANDYVLMVGTLEPRKNHVRLVEAFAKFRSLHPQAELIVAGARGWNHEPIVAALESQPGVRYEGAVSDDVLAGLLQGARVVAYPSMGEGFGLPVLEALAAGKPLLVGTHTTCADIAEDAAVAVNPFDIDMMAQGLKDLWQGVDDALAQAAQAERARAVAAQYDWARTARQTLACYREVCSA